MKSVLLITLALVVCTFSGCNTRIGWPGVESGWAVIGFLAVCCAILLGAAAICGSMDKFNDTDTHQAGWFFGTVAWVVAGLLLQALPHSESGIQFVPLPPWSYVSWVPRIISVACWLCLGVTVLFTLAPAKQDWNSGVGTVFIALCLNALLSFATPVGVTPEERPTPNQSDTIAKWEKLRMERSETLTKLSSDKDDLVARIRSIGAKSKKELMDNPLGRTLVDEYEQLCQQIVTLKREVDALESAIERAKSRLRTLERQAMLRGTKLTDKEHEHISGLDHELESELRKSPEPGNEVRLDQRLDEIFGGK